MHTGSDVQRSVLPRLTAQVARPFVSVLIGPRQVGKTTLLQMLAEGVDGPATYLDAENPDDALVLLGGMTTLLAEVGTRAQILLLDEFHRLPDALALFKQLRDAHPQIKVFASGSSSLAIHEHLRQSAVGRLRRTRVFPLSFAEWTRPQVDLDLESRDPLDPLPPRASAALSQLLERFLVWGGMPEAALCEDEDERREILGEIVALYLEKDVRGLLRSEEVIHFNRLLRLMAVRVGQTVNRSELGRTLGLPDRKLVRQLAVMEHTFVYRPVSTDYANPTKRLVKAPRLYWYDNGVRNALIRDFRPRPLRPDAGALLENHVFTELEKAAGTDVDIAYHRTHDGQEIDFVLERDRQKLLVEVKSSLHKRRIPPAIRDQLSRDDTLGAAVLNDGDHDLTDHGGKPVLFLPHVLAHTLPGWLRRLANRRNR